MHIYYFKLRNSSTQLNELRIRLEDILREKEEEERALDVVNLEFEEKAKILSEYEERYKPLIDIDLTLAGFIHLGVMQLIKDVGYQPEREHLELLE